jgi:L-malate glycosyltransferase
MIKICFLADADSVHTRKWVDYFSKSNCEIHIVSMRDTDYKFNKNVFLHIIKPQFKSKFSYFLLMFKIKKLVNTLKPDILHSHYASSYGLFGSICNYHPFVISIWGSDVNDFPQHGIIHKILFKHILKSSNMVCSTSSSLAENTKIYYDKDIAITPFGVDLKLFTNKISVLSNSYTTIGTVKNLEKIYGIDKLINAFAILTKKYKNEDLRLLIVGDGSEKQNLLNLCEKLDIVSKVNFVGFIDNNSVTNYINKMDIVCIPSISEGFGVSAVEACACGRPIVCTDVGGLSEIVKDGYNGYLCEPLNINDLEKKLDIMLRNKEKLKEFSENSRSIAVKKYDWNNNAKEMWKVYDKLISLDSNVAKCIKHSIESY